MKTILNRLINNEVLNKQEAKNVLINISKGNYNSNQIASFLTVYMMRTVTIDELEGFRDALLEMCVRIDLSDFNTIDLCGTGGDGKDTFNISTLSAFVVAGAGIQVAKHGNYGVSSISGSSNVLEKLGVKFSSDDQQLKRSLDHAGICVMHAPLFHPALKNVGQIRKDLAIKTFFNMLGPMVNPSFPQNQVVGVFNLEIARMYAYLYQNSEVNFAILHSMDGYDEISLTGPTKIIKNNQEGIFEPAHFGLSILDQNQIKGGNTIDESAKTFYDIISGNGTQAQQDVVCANAAIAISTVENCTEQEGFERAKRSLISGNAKKSLDRLIEMN